MKKLIKSFGFALKGLGVVLREQQNMRIHVAAVLLVVILGVWLHLSAIEWAIIALTFGFVLSAEMLNTAIEDLVNMISPGHHHLAGKIKDIAAGAVLVAAITAVIVGVCVLGTKILLLLG